MFSQQENHIPGTDARRRVCAYCCQEGDSSVKKITERALIGILAAFVEAQNRFRLETMGYAGEQVLTLGTDSLRTKFRHLYHILKKSMIFFPSIDI